MFKSKTFPYLVLLLVMLASSCSSSVEPIVQAAFTSTPRPQPAFQNTAVPATEGIFTISVDRSGIEWKRNFNPFFYQASNYFSVPLIYETLMHFDGASYIPWLATGYSWKEDNKILTFEIRKGVEWSDGSPFTAQDVAFTFNLLIENPNINDFPAPQQSPTFTILDQYIESIVTDDDFHVKFTFKEVNTLTINNLVFVPIVPKHVWELIEDPEHYTNEFPVGTGPFPLVTRFESDPSKKKYGESLIQFERHPRYWQEGKPYIQGVRLSYRLEEDRIIDLFQGEVDWVMDRVMEEFPIEEERLAELPAYLQMIETSVRWSGLAIYMNTARPPLDNKELRKSISMSIDRQWIADNTFKEEAVSLINVSGLDETRQNWWNQEAIDQAYWARYDPVQANAVLDRLGYSTGEDGSRVGADGSRLKLELIIAKDSSGDYIHHVSDIAQNITDFLKNNGIEVVVTPLEGSVWYEAFSQGRYDLAISYTNDYGPTPYLFYKEQMSGFGLNGKSTEANQEAGIYFSVEVDALLANFTQVSDPILQKAIIDEIQATFIEEVRSIHLFAINKQIRYFYNTSRFRDFPLDGEASILSILLNVK